MKNIQKKYGWKNADPTCAHDYLWSSILKLLPGSKLRVVDLGCGNGFLASALANLGHSVVGFDISEDGILIAKEKYPNVKFFAKSVYDDLTELGSNFDLAISSEVIEHLYDPHALARQAFNLLRPGGSFIVTTPYHGYFKNLVLSLFDKWDDHHTSLSLGWHIKFFSTRTLSRLLRESGFCNLVFCNSGRFPGFWKSTVCRSEKNKDLKS
ncbi:MAG: class I SAM-dependent methyltransferase [Candidatus Riflebacteria bacterium]|nr:class I SAM-dependent methyltransferase [Candidatus Riflebacteria bacterium]